MDEFEQTCIRFMVGGGLLDADVQRQLPFVRAVDRFHDPDGRRTVFYAEAGAPPIIPRDARLAADLVIAGIGPVTAHLDIDDGFIRLLAIDYPPQGWPSEPRILGFAEYPDP